MLFCTIWPNYSALYDRARLIRTLEILLKVRCLSLAGSGATQKLTKRQEKIKSVIDKVAYILEEAFQHNIIIIIDEGQRMKRIIIKWSSLPCYQSNLTTRSLRQYLSSKLQSMQWARQPLTVLLSGFDRRAQTRLLCPCSSSEPVLECLGRCVRHRGWPCQWTSRSGSAPSPCSQLLSTC